MTNLNAGDERLNAIYDSNYDLTHFKAMREFTMLANE